MMARFCEQLPAYRIKKEECFKRLSADQLHDLFLRFGVPVGSANGITAKLVAQLSNPKLLIEVPS